MNTSDRSSRFFAISLSSALTLLARTAPVAAQGPDESAARALFNDGRQLEKAGRYEEACSKFEVARTLFTSSGLLLNLADCHERINRTASAWTEFGDAAVAASNAARPRDEAEAKRRQAALEGRLSRLTIRATDTTPDQIIKRDGVPIDRAAWDSPNPVDPGTHAVTSEARGHKLWSTTVEIREPGKTVTVDVPRLVEIVPLETNVVAGEAHGNLGGAGGGPPSDVSPANAAHGSPDSRGTTQRALGLVLCGAGVLGMGASGVMGLVAKSHFESANAETTGRRADSVRAGELADAATVVLVSGAAIAVVGAVVWLTAPRAAVSVGTNGRILFLSGSFR